jgi:membrane protein DedA with SNARE-associated domain
MAAGIHAVPVWRFLRFDVLGAALWVPAMVAAGHAAGNRIGDPQDVMGWFNRGASWTVAVAAFVFITWFLLGREESKL